MATTLSDLASSREWVTRWRTTFRRTLKTSDVVITACGEASVWRHETIAVRHNKKKRVFEIDSLADVEVPAEVTPVQMVIVRFHGYLNSDLVLDASTNPMNCVPFQRFPKICAQNFRLAEQKIQMAQCLCVNMPLSVTKVTQKRNVRDIPLS